MRFALTLLFLMTPLTRLSQHVSKLNNSLCKRVRLSIAENILNAIRDVCNRFDFAWCAWLWQIQTRSPSREMIPGSVKIWYLGKLLKMAVERPYVSTQVGNTQEKLRLNTPYQHPSFWYSISGLCSLVEADVRSKSSL
eukprot:Blabericola_migrator_1__12457@NODE_786_length_6534_cov_13_057214_g556_i0_p4_GENE_NODE_786_length_6534_cov_13_057214_g556_i0NODE_786_length_6534_cov_13_057214_g556_i0_p4_ORF_typecomplete_len138_score11_97Diphthami_syn_2/PF01902_17/0_036_NODE_786_length_6534_cov_13_057214_g556_i020692482